MENPLSDPLHLLQVLRKNMAKPKLDWFGGDWQRVVVCIRSQGGTPDEIY
jgi:hypothetical protein